MQIRSEVRGNTKVVDLRGNWVTPPVQERLDRIAGLQQFTRGADITVKEKGLFLEFRPETTDKEQAALVEYINDNLFMVIGRAFTEIRVSPYHVPNNNNENGLGLLMAIVDETGCDADYGTWNSPVTLKPATSTQYNEIVDLLDTFELRYS